MTQQHKQPEQERTFHIGDILSITTETLVSPRKIRGVYDILNWMTGENLMTHQLPRANRECEDPLLRQFPDLADVGVPEWLCDEETLWQWLDTIIPIYGEYRKVRSLDPLDHTSIDPLVELGTSFDGAE